MRIVNVSLTATAVYDVEKRITVSVPDDVTDAEVEKYFEQPSRVADLPDDWKEWDTDYVIPNDDFIDESSITASLDAGDEDDWVDLELVKDGDSITHKEPAAAA